MSDIKCMWLDEESEICLNGDCPVCADFCPLSEYKGVCVYEEYEDDEYEDEYEYGEDSLEFIWGVKSYDDLSKGEANLYTMNDVDIIYNKNKETFALGIEIIYMFEDGKAGEVRYLERLLDEFTKFMESSGYDTNAGYGLWKGGVTINLEAETIPELYTQFRIFVEGYKALYGDREDRAI